MKAFEKGLNNHVFWKGFIFAVILSLLVSLFFTQDFAHAISTICVVVVMLVIFKYSPILGEIRTPEQVRQRDAGFIYWMGMMGIIFFFLFFAFLSVALLFFRDKLFESIAFNIGLWFILLSFIIVNCSNFYFWRKTRNGFFWLFGFILIISLFGLSSKYTGFFSSSGDNVFVGSLVIIILFLIGGIIYNLYIAMKYLVPYSLPLRTNSSWDKIHKK